MTESLFWLSYFAMWALVLVLLAAVFFLYRFHGQMLIHSAEGRHNQGPEKNVSIPPATARDLAGTPFKLGLADKPQFIFFASVKCASCARSRQTLKTFADKYGAEVDTVLVCQGNEQQVAKFAKNLLSSVRVVADPKWDAGVKLRVSSTPFALITDRDGIVLAKGMPDNMEGFEWFIKQLAAQNTRAATRAQANSN